MGVGPDQPLSASVADALLAAAEDEQDHRRPKLLGVWVG